MKEVSYKEDLKEKYFASKEELDKIRSEETLLKWKILSTANKLGKEIWSHRFTVKRLSKDMGLPYTTTKRCLSLNKATKKSWKLLDKKKISAFKLAQICSTKNCKYQDEIVKIVIKDNIPTHKIKGLKFNNIKDVKEWKHKKAVEKGYSRKDSASLAFFNWVTRGRRMLLMPLSTYRQSKHEKILKDLIKLRGDIDKYLNKYNALV